MLSWRRGKPAQGLGVFFLRFAHDLRRQVRRIRRIPAALYQIVPHVLLVEAFGRLARTVSLRGPKTGRIRGEKLVDQDHLSADHTELELGVRDDDPAGLRYLPAAEIDGDADVAHLLGPFPADLINHPGEADVLVMLAHRRLGRRSENGLLQPGGLRQPFRKTDAADRPASGVLLPGRAEKVAPHDTFNRSRRRLSNQ